MKVLFLSPIAGLGGAEQVLLTMTDMLRLHVPEVESTVLTLGDGPLVDALRERNVKVVSFPVPRALEQLGDSGAGALGKLRFMGKAALAIPALWRIRCDLKKTILDLQPDLIHSNGIKSHLLAFFAGLQSIPIVWHIHDFYGSRPLASKMLRWAAQSCSEGIAISQAVADDFHKVAGPRPVSIIHNAIDVSRFFPCHLDSQFPGDPASTPRGTLRVGMVATYARWKGQEIFFQSAAKILRILPGLPVQFYLVGGPIYQTAGSQYQENDLRNRTLELGISEKMRLICFQTKPEKVYSNLDIVVHASTKPEPFGLTIVEAMACGRPVVASLAGGVAEIIEDGKDAIGVPPGNVDCLVGALKRLLLDPELRMRLGANAREKAVKRFDRNRIGVQIRRVYERVLNRGVTPTSSIRRASPPQNPM